MSKVIADITTSLETTSVIDSPAAKHLEYRVAK